MRNKDITISLMIIITSITAFFIPIILFYIIAMATIFVVCYLVYLYQEDQGKKEKKLWQISISLITFLLAMIMGGRISICFYYVSLSLLIWFILYRIIMYYSKRKEKVDKDIETEEPQSLIMKSNDNVIIQSISETKNQEIVDKINAIEEQIQYIVLSIINKEKSSVALYDGQIKKLIDDQINLSKAEIYKNIDNQLVSMKNEFRCNNMDIGKLETELKNHINSIMNEHVEQDVKKLNRCLQNISIEKADYQKLKEELQKSMDNYIVSAKRSIDKTQEIVKQIGELGATDLEVIKNEKIREKFEEAFKVAKSEIDIVSPWINEHVMYKTGIYNYIHNAIKTGIKVKIVYGIGKNEKSYNEKNYKDKSNSRNKDSKEIAQLLEKSFKQYEDTFKIKRGDTHSKVLICDNKFAIIGSFNFLSFDGKYEYDTREELAVVTTDQRTINELRSKEFNF